MALRRAWTKFSITKVFKKKEEVVVVAVLTIITSALLSGYGVYYFLNLRTAKVKQKETASTAKTTISPNSHKSATPTGTKTGNQNSTESELQTAQTVLENFFTYLANKQYEEAAALYGWGHDDDPGNNLQAWVGANNAETLKNYCEAVDTCLKAKVLTGAKTNNDICKFLVQFIKNDGKIFEHPPYPGAETIATDFDFSVKKINGQFKVINPPLFFP